MSAHPVQCECCAPGCDCGCVDACPTHHGRAAEPDPPREEHGEVLTSAQIGEPCPACAGTAPTDWPMQEITVTLNGKQYRLQARIDPGAGDIVGKEVLLRVRDDGALEVLSEREIGGGR